MNRLLFPFFLLLAMVLGAPMCSVHAQTDGHSEGEHALHENHDAEEGHATHEEAHAHGDADHAHGDADHAHGDADHAHGDADHAHGDADHMNNEVIAHPPHSDQERFQAGDFIIHHIADAHDIHLFGNVHIPLPVLLYIEGHGVKAFMSNALEGHGHGDRFYVDGNGIDYTMHAEEGMDATGAVILAGSISAGLGDEKLEVWDFSITKSVFGMLLILSIMVWVFGRIASQYKKNPGKAPKGIANAVEPLILFIRDEIAKPSIGAKAEKFTPFLLTVFFFIFLCNLLGLVPFLGGFNITGTIGVTLVLAAMVFILTTVNGKKHYWIHIAWPPGVPLPIKFILVPIEMMSVFMKPIVLMIRLTANMSAGHIVILAFSSLIFIFSQGGEAVAAGTGVGIFSTLFMIFMYFLELLVAFLQAFVFTLLAAIYFGEATHEPAHH